MITECFVKGRFDYGVGKCAVVITEDVMPNEVKKVLHQAAWKVPPSWTYNGQVVIPDQYNCEILAAIYALRWCNENGKKSINIYTNTETSQRWYYLLKFPESREVMAKAYMDTIIEGTDLYADYFPKNDPNEFNRLVNKLAEELR